MDAHPPDDPEGAQPLDDIGPGLGDHLHNVEQQRHDNQRNGNENNRRYDMLQHNISSFYNFSTSSLTPWMLRTRTSLPSGMTTS